MAAAYDRFMRGSEEACLKQWRAELLKDLSGSVLEVGAGTGSTLGLYPKAVTRLVMAEPDRHMRGKLTEKVKSGAVEVSDASLNGSSVRSQAGPRRPPPSAAISQAPR